MDFMYLFTRWLWGQFFARQRLRNIGFRNFGGNSQVSLLKPLVLQPLLDHQTDIHRVSRSINYR